MHNPGSYRSVEQFNEEEKFFNESFASVIDGDYVLNYLNDSDLLQARSLQNPNIFGQGLPEMQTFPSFNESHKSLEMTQRHHGKHDRHDHWPLENASESNRSHYSPHNFKVENSDEFDGNIKTKKYKTNRETEMKIASDAPSRIKSNIKNTYINKINSLITEEKPNVKSRGGKGQDSLRRDEQDSNSNIALSRTGAKKIRPSDVLHSDEMEKLDVKLAKNRESARNSRIRKKVYIDLLEKTVDKLQKELAETKKQLETYTSNANKVTFQPKPVNNLYTAKQQLFERLEKMVSTKSDDSEISFLIDSLRLRFGASGKERVDVVNFMFKQVLEFLVPVHMKYILSVASQGRDLFTVTEHNVPASLQSTELSSPHVENTEYWTELGFQVNLSESQKKHMIRYKKKLMTEKQKFEGIIHDLNKVRKSVLKQANSLQTVVDDFRNYLSPTQTARLLLSLEKDRDRKEFSAEKLWAAVTLKKENPDESEASDNFLDPEDGDTQEKDGENEFEDDQ